MPDNKGILRQLRSPLVFVVVLAGLWALQSRVLREEPRARIVPYSELLALAQGGKVAEAEFRSERILATLKSEAPGGKTELVTVERLPNIEDPTLLAALRASGTRLTGKAESQSNFWPILLSALPLLLLPLLFLGGGILGRGRRGGPLTFGKSNAKLYDLGPENRITFSDVAGIDEAKAELVEVVSFLKEPAKYRKVGARIPKGVLLVGPPGTGKTLLAKAVAGESGVPFFAMSGSEFVEMFVGVGASRVRDMFLQAKGRAPCIIFIDELDAVGKTRAGAAGFASNEEREQTLNQLLVEMDGFDSGAGLVIMAATNRPEILDKALLRAGRFDRQVIVGRPDVRGREAILRVHVKQIVMGPDVDLPVMAQRTPGMVGADLANVVNEAALASVRRDGEQVTMRDFEEAVDRIQLGLKREGRVMTREEKRRVAIHETGHAVAALSVEHSDPVHRVTIIPRSIGALGATLQLPTEERYLMTEHELHDRICVLLAGRAGEDVVFGEVSTGAEDDLERATELARLMVTRFGMSSALGPVSSGRAAGRGSGGFFDMEGGREISAETARTVDLEIKSLIDTEYARAKALLSAKRHTIDRVSAALLEKETLDRAELAALVGPS
ncbi:MAG: ATP-dependent zinc metalloprotease FtsH [Myxococcales bacterium]|nr:ATP-dependent zinc metalloprotease FtsH [Myxococcales bacterium]